MVEMSKAALPPRQPLISDADRKHPRFAEYSRYRAWCGTQLIEAPSFQNWLYSEERNQRLDDLAKHPRYPEFLTWMRANKGGGRPCPGGAGFEQIFPYWLQGGRW